MTIFIMANELIPSEVFLDTSYAIALSSPKDKYYGAALSLAEELETKSTKLITTTAILLEIGNALSKRQHRAGAVQLLTSLEDDSTVEVISLTEELYSQGFKLYKERQDKDWGLVDCISFIVMKERNLTAALTADDHFIQAGFQALLRQGA